MAVHVSSATARLTRDRVELLGTCVDRVPLSTLPAWIEDFVESRTPHQIVTANLDFVATARKRPDFARVIAEADLVVCDGKPLQWAASIQGSPIPARVTGMDLVIQTAKLSVERGYRIFLLGAAPGVAEQAAMKLDAMFPGVRIVGVYAPPEGEFSDTENAHMVSMVREARPDALFVALGAPKQDIWIAAHRDELGVPLCAGIGGVFNFLSGRTRRAPLWMQRAGLEWAFRLLQEPSRLWRRYLVNDLPIFFELLMRQVPARARARIAGRGDDDEALKPIRLALVSAPTISADAPATSTTAGGAANPGTSSVRARRHALRHRRTPQDGPALERQPEDDGRVAVRGSAWSPF